MDAVLYYYLNGRGTTTGEARTSVRDAMLGERAGGEDGAGEGRGGRGAGTVLRDPPLARRVRRRHVPA